MDNDPDAADGRADMPLSTFAPDSGQENDPSRLPAVLDLFVGWVIRDGKGWVRRL